MISWPHLVASFLCIFTLQVGALQTESTAVLDREADTWSFSTLVDVLSSGDKVRLRAARKNIMSLCEASDFQHDVVDATSIECDRVPKPRTIKSGYREFAFALAAHVTDNTSFDTLTQAYDSIRHFHPQNSIIVVDNASPPDMSARVMDFLQNEPNMIYVREESSGFELGAYRRALLAAREKQWDVRGWVFLQATAVLLQPLPLESLPCKVSSFFEVGVERPPCGLPEFNRAEYEAFRQDAYRSNNLTEMGIQEFRRLKHEYPLWDRYEQLVCTSQPGFTVPSAMHNMFIATAEGSSGLEDLGFFSIRLEKKIHSNFLEGFNGVFLAALDSGKKSCFIDQERQLVGLVRGSRPGTIIHKQHGNPFNPLWNQGFFARLLSFISAVDANKDTLVDAAEIADAKANRPAQFGPALGSLCATMASRDPFQMAMCT
jgi:hypothetical protein